MASWVKTASSWALVSGLWMVGCAEAEFHCEQDGQCSEGVCERNGYCSFPDDACASGRRYAPLSGPLGEVCVDPEPADADDLGGGTTSDGMGSSEESGEGLESSGASLPDLGASLPAQVEFEDWQAEDFGRGTFEGTEFGGGLRLQTRSTDGTFVSRVFDAQRAGARWTELRWSPRAPYGKPLPDDGVSEAGYPEGNADLRDNVLLMHMDQTRPLAPGASVPESSGHAHPGVVQGAASELAIDAPFGTGTGLRGGASIALSSSGHDDFQFGVGDFTWSMWVRSKHGCRDEVAGADANQVYLGIEGGGGNYPGHMWLGCYNPATPGCVGPHSGRMGGTLSEGTGGDTVCGPQEHGDSQWHHAVLVKRGHAEASVTLWVDGRIQDDYDTVFENPFHFDSGTELTIGSLSGAYFGEFDVDEVAVYRRGLEDEEVEALYQRGALRVELQVRACATADCEGVEFIGPDGSESSAFVDTSMDGAVSAELPDSVGRYFQYRVVMHGAGSDLSPAVESVSVRATR